MLVFIIGAGVALAILRWSLTLIVPERRLARFDAGVAVIGKATVLIAFVALVALLGWAYYAGSK